MHSRRNDLTTFLLIAALGACTSTDSSVTTRDAAGNYVTTAEYEAMHRNEFFTAMQAGLDDFDQRFEALRERANDLGGSALGEFAEWTERLERQRADVRNALDKAEAALDDDWPKRRSEAVEAYEKLRNSLDEAYDEVLD